MAVFNNKQRIMPVYQVDENGTVLVAPATEATLAEVRDAVTGTLDVSGPLTNAELRAVAVPVSAAALPLPAGAATESTLSVVAGRLPASLGAKTPAGSLSVVDALPARFTVVAPSVTLGNGKSMLSVVSAGPVLRVERIYLVNVQVTGVTGVAAEFQLRRVTGHSAGTALTPQAHDTLDALGSVTAATGATVSGESSAYLVRGWWASDEWGPGTADVESFDHTMQTLLPAWGGYVIRSGQGLSVRCNTNTTSGTFDIVMVFTQE